MKKTKVIGFILLFISAFMIVVGMGFEKQSFLNKNNNVSYKKVDTKNITKSLNSLSSSDDVNCRREECSLTAIKMETTPASMDVPVRVEVYDHMTLKELGDKLEKYIGNDYLAGKGYFLASQCIEKGVDPYVATAIILHETGCGTKCSRLARVCNNVAGQKGKPSCGGGSFRRFPTLDAGITGFIDNLSKNYYSIGLNTVDKIAPKYAEGNTWAGKIKYFVNKMQNDK